MIAQVRKITVKEMVAFLKKFSYNEDVSISGENVQEDLPELLPSEENFQENEHQVAPHSTPRREENDDEISVIDLCSSSDELSTLPFIGGEQQSDFSLPFIGGEQQSDFSLPFIGGEQRLEETILLSDDEDYPGKPLEETITLESMGDASETQEEKDSSNAFFLAAPDEEIFGEYGIAKSSEYKIILKANVSMKMFLY